eukprot:5398852-Pleurochrysis_carterae.AAC.1
MIDDGVDAEQQTWENIWKEFLQYAQKEDKGRSAKENARIDEQSRDINSRETHLTLYPGKVEAENEAQ